MPVSALFLMGAMAIVLLGAAQALFAPSLPVTAPAGSTLAVARLYYLYWGVGLFTVGALGNLHCERRPGNQLTVRKAAFWMMFLGFNLAFFPTSPRRSHALMSDLGFFSAALGPDISLGIVLLAFGVTTFIFTRTRTTRSGTW
jgi:hypothetical protein